MTKQMQSNISDTIRVERFSGNEIMNFIPALAKLRIKVFFDFPYLYDGDMDYEKKYLKVYQDNPKSVVVIAFDGNDVIGASTGMPLADETEDVKAPFLDANIDGHSIFYFGESVLYKEYRGKGIGKAFFKYREEHALAHGFKTTAFCGVIRPDNHPLKPKDYQPLNPFWKKMGYEKQQGLITEFEWLDRDKSKPDKKELMFWMKHFE